MFRELALIKEPDTRGLSGHVSCTYSHFSLALESDASLSFWQTICPTFWLWCVSCPGAKLIDFDAVIDQKTSMVITNYVLLALRSIGDGCACSHCECEACQLCDRLKSQESLWARPGCPDNTPGRLVLSKWDSGCGVYISPSESIQLFEYQSCARQQYSYFLFVMIVTCHWFDIAGHCLDLIFN